MTNFRSSLQSQPFSYPRLTVRKLSHHSLTKLLADAHSSCLLVLAISQERSSRSHLLCLLLHAGRCWLLPSLGSACWGQGAGQAQHPHAAGTASVRGDCQARAQAWAQAVLIGRAKPCFWVQLGSPCCETCRQKTPCQVLEADVSCHSTHSCCMLY